MTTISAGAFRAYDDTKEHVVPILRELKIELETVLGAVDYAAPTSPYEIQNLQACIVRMQSDALVPLCAFLERSFYASNNPIALLDVLLHCTGIDGFGESELVLNLFLLLATAVCKLGAPVPLYDASAEILLSISYCFKTDRALLLARYAGSTDDAFVLMNNALSGLFAGSPEEIDEYLAAFKAICECNSIYRYVHETIHARFDY
jgi:hypothetical protein